MNHYDDLIVAHIKTTAILARNMLHQLSQLGDGIKCPMGIIVNNNRILVGLRHYTEDKWKKISVWTTPGGRSDKGETLEQTLRREIAEEVGITTLSIIGFIGEAPGAKSGDSVYLFHCTTTQDAKLMEPEKFSEWKWIPLQIFVSEEKYSNINTHTREIIVRYLKKYYNF